MTSNFARNGGLSRQTMDEYLRYGGPRPRNLRERVYFYETYLQDVVPDRVTVHVRPKHMTRERHEIQLLTPTGAIFMWGLVGTETDHDVVKYAAGIDASKRYRDGLFVPDWLSWRFFTGLTEIRFFSAEENSNEGWECGGEFHPINDAQYVAAYLQQEFDKLRYR